MLLSWQSHSFREAACSLDAGAHALLLTGPAGIGKRLLAEHIIRWRLCESPLPEGPCGHCDSCHLLAADNHPDRMLLEPRTESVTEEGVEGTGEPPAPKSKAKPSRYIVVDQVRELLGRLELSPHGKAGRVILIDPVDLMNPAAANALLKTLEEPAPRTIFILVTSAEERLPATVRSRCRRMPMGLPGSQDALVWLTGQGVADPQSALRLAGGAPLRAQALLSTNIMERWKTLNLKPTTETLRSLNWDTTSEDLAQLCLLLQMLCVDLQRAASGASPDYVSTASDAVTATARGLSGQAIADFWQELGRAKALIHHPLNGSLVRDQLLLGFDRLLTTSRTRPSVHT